MTQEYQTVMESQHHLAIYRAVIENSRMSDTAQIRKDMADRHRGRLAELIRLHFQGKPAKFIEATGINQGELSGLLKAKSFGAVKARNIEAQAGLLAGSLGFEPGSPFFESEQGALGRRKDSGQSPDDQMLEESPPQNHEKLPKDGDNMLSLVGISKEMRAIIEELATIDRSQGRRRGILIGTIGAIIATTETDADEPSQQRSSQRNG